MKAVPTICRAATIGKMAEAGKAAAVTARAVRHAISIKAVIPIIGTVAPATIMQRDAIMGEDDAARLRAKMEEARERKQAYDRAHPHPGQRSADKGLQAPGEEADQSPQRARDALDAPTRKRSHTPRTGDG